MLARTHGQPASPTRLGNSFVPGHSDLDLTIVLTEPAAGSLETVESIAVLLEHRKLLYYFLSPDDARIISTGELARMTGKWPSVEILVCPEDWTLLAGRELRQAESRSLSPVQITSHPEFNRWWGHILQDYLLRTLPGEENRYHRVFYRGAIKQTAYFMLARGMTPPADESSTGRGLTRWVLENHPELRPLLEGLERSKFWANGEEDIRERIFHEILRMTGDFYTGLAEISRPTQRQEPNPADIDPHLEAYNALAAKLETVPELKSWLAEVLVYPTPLCQPYFYQADLLLPDDITVTDLITLSELIRQAFQGRGIESKGFHYAITLVPVGVSRSPLVYRGSPFPFLGEHIERYGYMLLGQYGVTAQPQGQDLIEWCRIFLPYFTANLSRRIEHSSRTLNFCHIAAVRLFLETGEIFSDASLLVTRHQSVFGKGSPNDQLWGYLLRDKPGRDEHDLYLAAAKFLQLELNQVERMLDEQENQASRPISGLR